MLLVLQMMADSYAPKGTLLKHLHLKALKFLLKSSGPHSPNAPKPQNVLIIRRSNVMYAGTTLAVTMTSEPSLKADVNSSLVFS
ncbi:hypothetical protein D9758_011290 [Tetrapyrgos nigripes]|uniref:Uncharacterized protein n=1 Tax=Tetrapyrgos nigripes TaxID=182062 RepID=A0A8H5FSG1_9AGAR|nr:hypothetical protein D9758_011290 [Tetrapyrgos nigripes]